MYRTYNLVVATVVASVVVVTEGVGTAAAAAFLLLLLHSDDDVDDKQEWKKGQDSVPLAHAHHPQIELAIGVVAVVVAFHSRR